MQNLGGAVIPMLINTEKINFLVGDKDILNLIQDNPALPMFSDKMLKFLEDLSRKLMDDKRSRGYQDVMSYAYWIRKSSLERIKDSYDMELSRLGRGVSFHISPSNVPINFAVSMTSALLAGNSVVIRVSDKDFEQVSIVCDAINDLLSGEYEDIKGYFCIVRYPHDDEITSQISAICDIRIIWGGDETIRRIRSASIPPRAIEMTFADRHSIALIDSDYYLTQDKREVAKGFFTDTYYTDQNACSSPRLVVWFGSKIDEAKASFWNELLSVVKEKYTMEPVVAVDKYAAFCELAMSKKGAKIKSYENYIMRVALDELTEDVLDYKHGGGYFFEYNANALEEVLPVLNKRCQTISVLGIDKDKVRDFVVENGVRGVDRVVDLGQTMALEFVWDGYNMIENMTRIVYA